MGLFEMFNSKNGNATAQPENNYGKLPEIPEPVFVEKEKSESNGKEHQNGSSLEYNGIHYLFAFLDKNHEAKGYEDALMNPDSTHLDQNIEALKNDLARAIRKVKTYYDDYIRKTNFHISTRSKSGMVDTVEELKVEKETAEEHVEQVKEIEKDAVQNKGVGYGIIISYTRGFRNGLAAISHHAIMKKNF